MTNALDMLLKSGGWDLAWLSLLVAVALYALSGSGDIEDAGDAD